MITAITAHSGCEGTPLDSLDSVDMGISVGADCVEVDVQLDEEGVPRLTHDARADYSGTATLESAFKRIADTSMGINCDLKTPRALYPVLALAKRFGLNDGRLIFSGSVSCDLLASDPDIARDARIYLNIEEIAKYFYSAGAQDFAHALRKPWSVVDSHLDELLENDIPLICRAAASVGAYAVNAPYAHMTDEHIAHFAKCGTRLSLWTVNDESAQSRLLSLNLCNITTTNVRRALSIRNAIKQ